MFDDFKLSDIHSAPLATPSNTLVTTEWNDQKFKSLKGVYGCERASVSSVKGLLAARKFLDWYAGLGLESKEVVDCIQAMCETVTVGESPIFIEDFFSPDKASLDIRNHSVTYNPQNWAFNYVLTTSNETFTAQGNSQVPIAISVRECLEWYKAIKAALNPPEQGSSDEIAAETTSIAYLAFLGMNIIRLVTKPLESVANHITSYTMSSFSSLYGDKPAVSVTYSPPPSADTLKKLKVDLDGNDILKKRLLYPFVYSYAFYPDIPASIRGLYVASFLLSVNCTGLSTLNWADRAAEQIGVKRETLCEATFTNATGRFWTEFADFLATQTELKTWPFARLFQPSAFANFAVSKHRNATAIFVAIATGSTNTNDPIWSTEHLKSLTKMEITSGINYAAATFDHFIAPTEHTAKFRIGKQIAENAKKGVGAKRSSAGQRTQL